MTDKHAYRAAPNRGAVVGVLHSAGAGPGNGRGMSGQVRPVELAEARGTGECVHCSAQTGTYCRSCRQPLCPPDLEVHVVDHREWHRRWTRTEGLR